MSAQILDNTAGGHAIADAARLQALLDQKAVSTGGAGQSKSKAPKPS